MLLFSSHLSVLTTVAETLLTLLYPFKWEHVYVPVLPLQLLEFVNAPTPFIMGVHPGTLPARRDRLLNRHSPTHTPASTHSPGPPSAPFRPPSRACVRQRGARRARRRWSACGSASCGRFRLPRDTRFRLPRDALLAAPRDPRARTSPAQLRACRLAGVGSVPRFRASVAPRASKAPCVCGAAVRASDAACVCRDCRRLPPLGGRVLMVPCFAGGAGGGAACVWTRCSW